MAISVAKRNFGSDGTGSAGFSTAAFSSNTVGNTLIVMATQELSTSTAMTISDTNTNTWTLVLDSPNVGGSGNSQRVWAAYNCKASAGTNTITVNNAFTPSSIGVYEAAGLASSQAFDKSAGAQTVASTTPASGNTATTTNNNELVLAMSHDNGSTLGTYTAGAGYSNIQVPAAVNGLISAFEEKIISSAAAENGTFNLTASNGDQANTVVTFSDTLIVALPTVTTQAESSIGKTSGTGNGNITVTGGATNDHRGVVYDTVTRGLPGNVAPGSSGYASNVDEAGSFSTGAFTESMTGLTKNTTYFVRAYAHNSAGYSYGSEISFAVTTSVPLLDKTSDLNTGFTDDITSNADDKVLLESGSNLLLETGDKAIINYSYPSQDYMTYTVPGSLLANSTTYYWRVRQYRQLTTYTWGSLTITNDATGVWFAPPGCTQVYIVAQASGASGGGGTITTGNNGGGGGGGAYSAGLVTVTPGVGYSFAVGQAVSGTSAANGTDGNDTWFKDTSTILAKGGVHGTVANSPGQGGAGGSAASGFGDVKLSGGNGGNGASAANAGGGGGGSAGNSTAGGNGGAGASGVAGAAGAAGTTIGAAGGAGSTNGAGSIGSIPGGGGGGAGSGVGSNAGGNGVRGTLTINFRLPVYTQTYSPWSEIRSFVVSTAPPLINFSRNINQAINRGSTY